MAFFAELLGRLQSRAPSMSSGDFLAANAYGCMCIDAIVCGELADANTSALLCRYLAPGAGRLDFLPEYVDCLKRRGSAMLDVLDPAVMTLYKQLLDAVLEAVPLLGSPPTRMLCSGDECAYKPDVDTLAYAVMAVIARPLLSSITSALQQNADSVVGIFDAEAPLFLPLAVAFTKDQPRWREVYPFIAPKGDSLFDLLLRLLRFRTQLEQHTVIAPCFAEFSSVMQRVLPSMAHIPQWRSYKPLSNLLAALEGQSSSMQHAYNPDILNKAIELIAGLQVVAGKRLSSITAHLQAPVFTWAKGNLTVRSDGESIPLSFGLDPILDDCSLEVARSVIFRLTGRAFGRVARHLVKPYTKDTIANPLTRLCAVFSGGDAPKDASRHSITLIAGHGAECSIGDVLGDTTEDYRIQNVFFALGDTDSVVCALLDSLAYHVAPEKGRAYLASLRIRLLLKDLQARQKPSMIRSIFGRLKLLREVLADGPESALALLTHIDEECHAVLTGDNPDPRKLRLTFAAAHTLASMAPIRVLSPSASRALGEIASTATVSLECAGYAAAPSSTIELYSIPETK